jgi:hypothetical protein
VANDGTRQGLGARKRWEELGRNGRVDFPLIDQEGGREYRISEQLEELFRGVGLPQ